MTKQPRIAFCTTCKGRSHHIKQSLPRNIIDNAGYPNSVFVILNYGSPDDLMEYLQTEHKEGIDSGKVVVYTYKTHENFKMAHAKNMVHRLGILEGADILVNVDADNISNHAFAQYIARTFSEFGNNIFMWSRMIPSVLPRGISGRIAVTSDAFLRLGGYDEKFETWSPDDKDFTARLIRSGIVPHEICPYYLNGVRHTDKIRFREYPHAKELSELYDHHEVDPWATNTIVNFGRFGMGTVTRNFDSKEIVLGPLPTRIFGIGMHKTGTTSLSKALHILGYSSAHWLTPRWARTLWEEMREKGVSLTVEHYMAITDFPLTIIYKELDKAYPNSKFILTIRDEKEWLESVEKHWNPNFNKWRNDWKNDCFTNRMHQEVYGRKSFDAEIFLERYRRHNLEVLEYFKNRPDDLFVMHIDKNTTWTGLCGFLHKPIPHQDYPRANITLSE